MMSICRSWAMSRVMMKWIKTSTTRSMVGISPKMNSKCSNLNVYTRDSLRMSFRKWFRMKIQQKLKGKSRRSTALSCHQSITIRPKHRAPRQHWATLSQNPKKTLQIQTKTSTVNLRGFSHRLEPIKVVFMIISTKISKFLIKEK